MVQSLKQHIFGAAVRLGAADIHETIVVTGSPRSGTTWLSELLRELPEYRMLNEPLNLNSSVLAEEIEGLNWRTSVPNDEEYPSLQNQLRRALTGRVEAPHMWRFRSQTAVGRLFETVTNRKLVVKLIRAGRMLSWFSKRFPVRAIVSTFRHPCAVVASQMSYRDVWRTASPPSKDEIRNGFGGTLPEDILNQFDSVLSTVDSTASQLAAVWSLDTYLTLRGPMQGPWIVTTYESLVDEAAKELHRILQQIGESMPEGMQERISKPSGSASDTLRTDRRESQLAKWRDQLSERQVADVLTIAHKFGLDFYTRSLRPNREKLYDLVREARAE